MKIQGKIEYVKNDPNGNKYHVYKREKSFLSFFTEWEKSEQRKTLQEAEEKVKSLNNDGLVEYLGIYENGVRKGTMAWDDPAWRDMKIVKPLDLPDTEEVEFERLPKNR